MRRDYDTIVLGLGGIGSAALYWLSRRLGEQVLGLEQFELGHERGGSEDHSRIIRYSYHTSAYVRLAAEAYRCWRQVEAEAREELLVETGGLDLFPAGGAIPISDYTGSLDEAGVPYEILDGGQIARRWPEFRGVDAVTGLFQPAGGMVRAARCNAAHRRLARASGAAIRAACPVTSVRPGGGELEVLAGGDSLRCRRLVVAAGAWSNRVLASFDFHLPLTVTREQVAYYRPRRSPGFEIGRFPVWIWMDEPCFYGFPEDPPHGVKVAQDVGGREVDAEGRDFEPDAEALERLERFCARHLPGALARPAEIHTCLYTLTPDRDFVIDRIPGHPACAVAIGAGHAFKFASVIGRILSGLALDEPSPALAPFRIDRPILRMEDPPRRFMH